MTALDLIEVLRPWRAAEPGRFVAISRGRVTLGAYGFEAREFSAPEDAITFAASGGTLAPVAPSRSRKLPNTCKQCGKPARNVYCSVACANTSKREASAAV